MRNVIELLIEVEKQFPDKLAIVENQVSKDNEILARKFTYSKLLEDVWNTACALKKKEMKKGDRIILFIPMSYETYIVMLANMYIGAVTVFVDAWADKKRMEVAIDTVKPKAIIISSKSNYDTRIFQKIDIIEVKEILELNLENFMEEEFLPEYMDKDDELIVTFTTGSTGVPKAAKRTHEYCFTQFKVISKYLNYNKDSVNLVTLPIFLLGNLFMGITSVIPNFNPKLPSDINEEDIINKIRSQKVNSAIGSTIFFQKLGDYLIEKGETLDIDKIVIGGSPVFKTIAKRLKKAFPKSDIEVLYGATEVVPISYVSVDEILNSVSNYGVLVGKPVKEIEVKIIKKVEGNIELKDNHNLEEYLVEGYDVGEIIVNGSHVLKTYLENKYESSNMKIVDGKKLWHRTGDGGRIDKYGNLYLYGRVKNSFEYEDKLIFTLPLEQIIQDINNVSFAVIIKINKYIYVFIETDSNDKAIKEEIKLEVLKVLSFININNIIFMEKIPRDPRHNSKVNYEKLKEMYQ